MRDAQKERPARARAELLTQETRNRASYLNRDLIELGAPEDMAA